MGAWTTAGRSGLYQAALTGVMPPLYAALYSSSADPSGSPVELTLAGYARQLVAWGYVGTDQGANLYDVTFGPMAAGAYLGVGILTDPIAGTLWFWDDESGSITIGASTTVDFPSGQMILQRV